MNEIDQAQEIFAVWTNTDLTEGRGSEYVKFYCKLKSTARRLAKGNYVQGSDCRITTERMISFNGKWYAPGPHVDYGTREDALEEQQALAAERKQIALDRARELGLTDEEIAILAG